MAAPRQLGLYRLSHELSRGGMGAVYEATHTGTGGRYAVKVILTDRAGALDPALEARFRREAEALAQVSHPNVVRIHSADLEGAVPYIVQQLLLGGTLEDRLARGPLPIDEAVAITIKLADGLAAAHDRGILHRDLKPENVMFNERGEPLLVDFGVARILASSQRLTQTGELMGTPCYMSPEQAKGHACDTRADVYGLGALLYAMLTAQPPSPSKSSVLLTLAAVVNDPVTAPSTFRADIPRKLEAICLRALAKTPGERFPTLRAFGETLAKARGEHPETRGEITKVVAAAVVSIMALLTLGAVWLATHSKRPASAEPRVTLPSPSDPAAPESEELRDRARIALRKGDVAAATSAALLARTLGHDVEAWRTLRGLTYTLAGEFETAKGFLRSGSKAAAICEAERARCRLEEQSHRGLTLRTESYTKIFDGLGDLLNHVHILLEFDPVGPLIMTRAQTTIITTILRLGQPFCAGRVEPVGKLLSAAIDLSPEGPGAGAVGIGWAYLLFVRHEADDERLWQEIRRKLERALARDSLDPRWLRNGLLLQAAISKNSLLGFKDLFALDKGSHTRVEREVLETCCRLLTDRWFPQLTLATAERRPVAAAVAWRNAIAYSQARRRLCHKGTLGRSTARLNVALLMLLPRQAKAALRILEEAPIAEDHTREFQFLRAEAELLIAGSDLQASEIRIKELVDSPGANSYVRSLLAAIKFARGNADGGFATLFLAEEEEKQVPFNDSLRTPFWRTPEQTRLESASKPGIRAFLAKALRRN